MFLINLIKYIFLGIVQGIAEPIPISSSGHLIIIKKLLNDSVLNDINFEIIVNFGSFIAIVLIFKDDIIELIKGFCLYIKTKERKYYDAFKYCWLIVIGIIPAGICGLLLRNIIEENFNSIKIVGFSLLITSLLLFSVRNIKGQKKDENITFKNALIIGLFQVASLFPGISRSGTTLAGGLVQGLKIDAAYKFSFMLYMPISIATLLLGVKDLASATISPETYIYYLVGMIVACVFTYFSAKIFRKIISEGNLLYFAVYCSIIGTLVLLFL